MALIIIFHLPTKTINLHPLRPFILSPVFLHCLSPDGFTLGANPCVHSHILMCFCCRRGRRPKWLVGLGSLTKKKNGGTVAENCGKPAAMRAFVALFGRKNGCSKRGENERNKKRKKESAGGGGLAIVHSFWEGR